MNQKYVVFISLILDLLGFTLILPLFPKIFEFYHSNKDDETYHMLHYYLDEFRKYFAAPDNKGFNSVLFGGFVGSIFSLLQFISSTLIGAASDSYGRKPVLLLVMLGTLLSYLVWSVSSCFMIFLISRIIGGISKANVSLSIAIMTDLSDAATRSSAMALVGIAFSLGFLIGPCVGAVFSSKLSSTAAIYTYPSYLAIALTIINLFFVAKFYKESLPTEKRSKSFKNNLSETFDYLNPATLLNFSLIKSVSQSESNTLKKLGLAQFLYLFIYSGLEFTLTFLVHNKFSYNSIQQGKMFLFIGICMVFVQGGYVRRIKQGNHVRAAIKAILVLIPALVILGLANSQAIFYIGLALYCYASAVVVQCFTTVLSNFGNDDEKGKITGIGRSITALARAFGPVCNSMVYWTFGPASAYVFGSVGLIIPLCILLRLDKKLTKKVA